MATLIVSLLLSAFVSIESLLSPRTMWRQLRKASVELESIIWKYRTCVGEFKVGLDTTRNAEDNLYKVRRRRCNFEILIINVSKFVF